MEKQNNKSSQYTESPSLSFSVTSISSGFVTREVTMKATGSSLQESAQGLDFIIDLLKRNKDVFGHD